MARMGASKRSALRFAVYIRCLGGEPLPFAHKGYRAYALALQRQYEQLRQTLDPVAAQEARRAGRLLIRQKSLLVAASNSFLVIPPDSSTHDGQQDPGSTTMPAKSASTKINGSSATADSEGENLRKAQRLRMKDARNCRRKIRHSNYLSALQHACNLAQNDINIYPCPICDGLHLGHDPSSETVKKRKQVRKKLNRIAQRLQALEREKRQLEDQRRALIVEQGAGSAAQDAGALSRWKFKWHLRTLLQNSKMEKLPEASSSNVHHFSENTTKFR